MDENFIEERFLNYFQMLEKSKRKPFSNRRCILGKRLTTFLSKRVLVISWNPSLTKITFQRCQTYEMKFETSFPTLVQTKTNRK